MMNPIYNLPDIAFVGGESQTFLFSLLTPQGNDFDASECNLAFAIINYTNKNGAPILAKNAKAVLGKNGIKNIASVELLPEDTLNLHGRYIYQLSIRDKDNNAEIPGQGVIEIRRNIHTEFISQ